MRKLLDIALNCAKSFRQRKIVNNTHYNVLYQFAPIADIFNGNYERQMTCGEIRKKGDFGLGTFEGLDGEMVVLDGKIYQITGDGQVSLPADGVETPFVAITHFQADAMHPLTEEVNLAGLTAVLDNFLPNKGIFYAIKIQATFKYIKVRSGFKQPQPYPSLTEVLRQSLPTFELTHVQGTLVGFWCPKYAESLNVPGYHFHFLTLDEKAGGHVDECLLEHGQIEIDEIHRLYLDLPIK